MPQYTAHTPLLPDPFMEELRRVRAQGFARSEQEFEEGINAVAAPILDLGNQPVASVAVAGPAYRLTQERMAEIGPDVVATAYDVSRELEMVAHAPVGAGGNRPASPRAGV
jgi:DNA-binding IclR family transcriptional regulator